jgi:hypothetical protein
MLLGVKRGSSVIHIPLMITSDSSLMLMSLDNNKNDCRNRLEWFQYLKMEPQEVGVFFYPELRNILDFRYTMNVRSADSTTVSTTECFHRSVFRRHSQVGQDHSLGRGDGKPLLPEPQGERLPQMPETLRT